MQSKLFGDRTVLDIVIFSHIFDVNESNRRTKASAYKAFGRFSKSYCLEGQDRQGAVFAASNAYLRNVFAHTFFSPVKDNSVIVDYPF
jgi:hypothetical protein